MLASLTSYLGSADRMKLCPIMDKEVTWRRSYGPCKLVPRFFPDSEKVCRELKTS